MPPQRVVIDPNVWVSALLSPKGAPAGVLRAVLADQAIAVVSPHLLDELGTVLARRKFRRWITLEEARAFVAAVAAKAEVYPDGEPRRATRDPDDDYLVGLAERSGAVIITGDADLLSADLNPVAMTPRDLLESLPSRQDGR